MFSGTSCCGVIKKRWMSGVGLIVGAGTNGHLLNKATTLQMFAYIVHPILQFLTAVDFDRTACDI